MHQTQCLAKQGRQRCNHSLSVWWEMSYCRTSFKASWCHWVTAAEKSFALCCPLRRWPALAGLPRLSSARCFKTSRSFLTMIFFHLTPLTENTMRRPESLGERLLQLATTLGCPRWTSRFSGEGESCLFFLSLGSNLFLIKVRSQTSQTHPGIAATDSLLRFLISKDKDRGAVRTEPLTLPVRASWKAGCFSLFPGSEGCILVKTKQIWQIRLEDWCNFWWPLFFFQTWLRSLSFKFSDFRCLLPCGPVTQH